jgi:hypothetical protein
VVSGQEEDWSPGFWPWEWGDVERGNVVAGGSGFTSLMAWGRTNWPLRLEGVKRTAAPAPRHLPRVKL